MKPSLFPVILLASVLFGCGSGSSGTTKKPAAKKPVSLSGRIVKGASLTDPAVGVVVSLAGRTDIQVTTGADGRFSIGGLTPGRYSVVAAFTLGAKAVSFSAADAQYDGAPLDLGDLPLPGAVEGRVLLAGGADPAGIEVTLDPAGVVEKTDADGHYMLMTRAGSYELRATRTGYVTQKVAALIVAGESTPLTDVVLAEIPRLDSLAPSSGPVGTQVTLAGTGFGAAQAAGSVRFDAVPATVVSWSDHTLVVSVPPGAGAGSHAVTVHVGDQVTLPKPFLVLPGLTSLAPAEVAFGDTLVVRGTNFGTSQGTAELQMDGTALSIVSWADTRIDALVPAGQLPGLVTLIVVRPGLASAGMTVGLRPSVLGAAARTPGAALPVTGANFGPVQGSVTLGGLPATVTTWGAAQIGIVVPAQTPGGSQPLVVTANGHSSQPFSMHLIPLLNGVSLLGGPAGTPLTLSGAAFGNSQGNSTVSVGGVTAPVLAWSNSSIQFSIPSAVTAGTRAVSVTVAGETGSGVAVLVIPGITGVSPAAGPALSWLTLTGTNFGSSPGLVAVGSAFASVVTWTDTRVVVRTPILASPGPVSVTVNATGLASTPGFFTVLPNIINVIPASGVAGSNVKLQGFGFGAVTGTVSFNGTPGVVSAWSPSQASATVPASLAAGLATVVITAGGYPAQASFTVLPTLTAPSQVTAVAAQTPFTVNVTWHDNTTTELAFGIERKTGPAGTYALLATAPANVTQYTDTSAGMGRTYAYRVFAYNSQSSSKYGLPATMTTPGVNRLAAGGYHTCVTAWGVTGCWGDNTFGELGIGSAVTASNNPAGLFTLPFLPAGMAMGLHHTCMLSPAGAVWCWGNDANAQVGNGVASGHVDSPSAVNGMPLPVTALASGGNHACAVRANGSLRCWGSNAAGELGLGATTPTNVTWPTAPAGLGPVRLAGAGEAHTCAALTAGGLSCWGLNDSGQLGIGSTVSPQPSPVAVGGIAGSVISVAGGARHTCAVTAAGSVACWGKNDYGQMGRADAQYGAAPTYGSTTPVLVNGLAGTPLAVAAGSDSACVLMAGGAVFCWGRNDSGQLGVTSTDSCAGSVNCSKIPLAVPLAEPATSLSAGALHTCVSFVSGRMVCWGSNAQGQLGNGGWTDSAVPVEPSLP